MAQSEDLEALPSQPWLSGNELGGQAGAGDASGTDDAGENSLRRVDTMSIVDDFQGAGFGVIFAGVALAAVYSSIAAVLVWYSSQVPRTCNVDMRTTFRLMGSLDGVLGVLMVCFFLAVKSLVEAMSHGVLADKYESEGRVEEAERQKEEAAKKMAGAFLQGCFPSLGFLLMQVFLLSTWIYGLVQAYDADRFKCGSAVTVFWVMLSVNVGAALFSLCLEPRRADPAHFGDAPSSATRPLDRLSALSSLLGGSAGRADDPFGGAGDTAEEGRFGVTGPS